MQFFAPFLLPFAQVQVLIHISCKKQFIQSEAVFVCYTDLHNIYQVSEHETKCAVVFT